MDKEIFESKKTIAYFLWEYTNCDNTFCLWQCAENIAQYFKREKLFHPENVFDIIYSHKNKPLYINFIRQIAFRIFLYTQNKDEKFNWYAAEKLISNSECLLAILKIANQNN